MSSTPVSVRGTRSGKQVVQVGQALVSVMALVAIVVPLIVASRRIGYPYELEWLEGGSIEHVRRIVQGHDLYAAPSVTFVAFVYPPFYPLVCAAFASVVGVHFWTLRLVSLLASLGAIALLFRIVRQETGSRWAGLLTAAVYSACYQHVGTWFDIGKVDALFLFLTLASIDVVRRGTTKASAVAGVLMALAILTKQTALFVAAPVGVYLLITRRRPGLAFTAIIAVFVGCTTLVMNALSHGWFDYYAWEQLFQHGTIQGSKFAFFTVDLQPFWPALIIAALALVAAVVNVGHSSGGSWFRFRRLNAMRLSLRPRWSFGLIGASVVGMVAGSWASRLHEGGFINVLMPACAAVALVMGLGLGELFKSATPPPVCVPLCLGALVLCGLQFAFLSYSPAGMVPTARDRQVGDGFISWVSDIPGPVLITSHPSYATLASKKPSAAQGSVDDVLRASNGRAKRQLLASYANAIHQHEFSAIILDGDKDPEAFPADWKQYYVRASAPPIPNDGVFVPVASPTWHPTQTWVPK